MGKRGDNQQDENGLGYSVVKNLLVACNYLQKGYHIFADNFFSRMELAKYLYDNYTFFRNTKKKQKRPS